MTLTWDTSYAIALELKRSHQDINIEEITLQQIYEWTLQLQDFVDDPALCNDEILSSIYQEWYEEIINDREQSKFTGLRHLGRTSTCGNYNNT